MSSTLVFGMQAFRLPLEDHPHFVVLFEQSASSNVFSGNGTLVRQWNALEIGTPESVLVGTLSRASSCEGGMLKLDGKWCRPETYYSRAEKAVKEAVVNPLAWDMRIRFELCVLLGSEERRTLLEGEELMTSGNVWTGLRAEVVLERVSKWLLFVEAHPELPAWTLAEWKGKRIPRGTR